MTTNIWLVVKKDDGSFDIFHRGELLHGSIPDKWLESELARYGFCGPEYQEIRRHLEEQGRAEMVL
jgi:hypothetical protein